MFYVNDDDTDNLFRKAAENYDIDAEAASDWNAVLQGLNKDATDQPEKTPKRRRRFIAFWWLLLLPVAGAVFYWSTRTDKATVQGTRKDNVAVQKEAPAKRDETSLQGNGVNTTGTRTDNSVATGKTNNSSAGIQIRTNSNSILQNKSSVILKPASGSSVSSKDFGNNLDMMNSAGNKNSLSNSAGIDKSSSDDLTKEKNNGIPDSSKKMYAKSAATEKKDSLKQTNNAITKNVTDVAKNKNHYFYAGLNVAGDISFVKFQKTSDPGLNGGIILGYRFNRWQVETGLQFDKKNYYSAGKYFDKSSVPYLNYVDFLSVTGNCNMTEIPLNIRYNISRSDSSKWYVYGGVSSYLMSKEFYTYDYIHEGSYNQKDYTYRHSSKDWLSIMNLGFGYEFKLGKTNNIRMEYFYKVPLGGVGKGNLPLSSTGINLAFTKRF